MCGSPQKARERERERERNSPGGLICLSFFIFFQIFSTGYAALPGCSKESTTSTKNTDDAWGWVYVIKGNDGHYWTSGAGSCNPVDDYDKSYCYISDKGSGSDFVSNSYFYANMCGGDCQYHAERYGNCTDKTYKAVPNKQQCNNFEYGVLVCDGEEECTNLADGTYPHVTVFGKNFTFDSIPQDGAHHNQAYFGGMLYGSLNINNASDCLNQGGTHSGAGYCYFENTIQINNNKGANGFYDAAYTWDTSKCHFYEVETVFNHCKGKVYWNANKTAGGDAAHGFYLRFDVKDARLGTNPLQPCSCEAGWLQSKPEDTNGPRECNTCDTAGHWKCSGDTASCVYGYYQSGTGESAICNLKQNFECTDAAQNVCYCKSGFVLNNTGQCGGPSGTQCKSHFQYENGECVCDPQFVLNTYGDNNPENDTCDFDTVKTYTDATGTFTLISEEPDCPIESAP